MTDNEETIIISNFPPTKRKEIKKIEERKIKKLHTKGNFFLCEKKKDVAP